jgi:hypothetical protein
MPAIYALRRGAAEPVLSETAREAFDFIVGNRTATSGDIRRLLKAEGHVRPDPADLALAELQRELLVDRGPSSSPGQGVFYLSREGYPYRAFAPAHPDFISSAALLSRSQAGVEVVKAYLAAAVVVSHRQLAKLFELLLSSAEVDDTIDMLRREGLAHSERQGRQVFIWFGGRVPSPGSL